MTRPPRLGAPAARLFYARTFALLTLAVLGYLCFLILLPFFEPLAWASILAFLLHPVYRRLRALRPHWRNASAMALTVATFFFLIGPLTLLGIAFADQAANLIAILRGLVADYREPTFADLAQTPLIGSLLDSAQSMFNIPAERVEEGLISGAQNLLRLLATLSGEIFLGAVSTVTGFTIMIFVLFFIIRDGESLVETTRKLIPMRPDRADRLFDHIGDVMRAVVFGVGLTAMVQGSLVGAAFAVLGLAAPVVFGAVSALFALLPVGGTAFVWVPAAAILAGEGRYLEAVFLVAWGFLLVSTIDNLLRPLVVSRTGHIGTLTVFIGVLGGVTAFGTVGLILGPVVLALAIALIRFTLELREERQQAEESEEASPSAS